MPDEQNALYNPLAISGIAESVVRELFSRACHPLTTLGRFSGAGVYAVYYRGDFAEYAPIAYANQQACVTPIYVGKAIPKGGRKGVIAGDGGSPLFGRLTQHAESLSVATNLRVEDFLCRYLSVEELFIEIAERQLIQQFKPVWNVCLDGFGNHDPGKGRYGGQRPGWDEVHPGRAWATKCQPSRLSAVEWRAAIREYLARVEAGLIHEVVAVDDGDED